MTQRVAVLDKELCQPKKCGLECIKYCPVNKSGADCIVLNEETKKAQIDEDICNIINKIQLAKPNCKVTTPITSAVNALKHLSLKKISIFTPYPQPINEKVINYFIKEGFDVRSFASFNLDSDLEIGKIDPKYLLEVLTEMNTDNAEALFISCTALPALGIIQELENKIKKIVLSSNQALIWNSIRSVGYTTSIEGYGELLKKN